MHTAVWQRPRAGLSLGLNVCVPLRTGRRAVAAAQATKAGASAAHEDASPVVVVGGGWAGFGAAHALAKAGVKGVRLLDASPPEPTSLGGKRWEPGIKGFWADYANIFAVGPGRTPGRLAGWLAGCCNLFK
jgi:hypothetical protein